MVQIVPILFFIDINNTYQLNNKTYSVGLFFKTMKIKHLKFFLRGKGKKKKIIPKSVSESHSSTSRVDYKTKS